ncbi:MFS polyamine transporter [Guyanagaster necrorhizus]|uniref:MFS polyamine transporter n=1 Tax=Guyanagaster necrorhizus TaxID=856835 RepID=A0A9P7VPW6_9AGAR|nr:MFS polyamine transporter [Guyanagaster necrorhizus MCA 3950]KAG7444518.1 MFS polyamine transporter [Guyanagaster necrorhizus MCA 3950]
MQPSGGEFFPGGSGPTPNDPEHPEGLSIKSLKDVDEASLDPRLSLSATILPAPDDLDVPLSRQFSQLVQGRTSSDRDVEKKPDYPDPLYVEFEKGDTRNPINFLPRRKWAITMLSSFATLLAASTAAGYNLGFDSMTRDLNCTRFQATVGLSTSTLGFGVTPLFTASFSEEFGRQPLYFVSAGGFFLMHIMVALAKNIQTVIIARFLQGAFGSTWATMVGGTIADIWVPEDRGLPMTIFTAAAIGGTGVGPIIAGWIEMNGRLEWKWIQWIQMMMCGLYIVLLPFVMKETRSSILLTRLAKKIRKKTGDKRYRARVEDERASLRTLIFISCTRPIHLLLTEPIVFSFSLWVGFCWGVVYALVESIPFIFRDLHGFNAGQLGNAFAVMIVGSLLGVMTNFFQEKLYHKNYPHRGPEARLYMACAAAIMLPVGMFIYAWTSFPFVPWIASAIGITIFMWAMFIVYLAVFTYFADTYGPFASSALAGQSLCRNLAATAFPLFTTQMYNNLGYTWASTLFACIATVMIPIPFVLFFYGPSIRRHSKFSSMVLHGKSATS